MAKKQREKYKRVVFLCLIMILFITGAYSNWYFQLDSFRDSFFVTISSARHTFTYLKEENRTNGVDNQEMESNARENGEATRKTLGTDGQVTTLVYASGEPVGIYIKTDGVLVLGTQAVKTENNREIFPAENKIQSGDYILKVNEKEVSSKTEFLSFLQENGKKEIVLTIQRNGEKQKVKISPTYSVEDECYQIGVWIRDDTQGIGTVTFLTEDGFFGALGHGINDSNLGVKMNISGGSIYRTNIASIMKGQTDHPGEVIGSINYIPENYLGNIRKNTSCGIFGEISNAENDFQHGELLEIADRSEIKTGEALIRTSISGESRDYTIKIKKVSTNKKNEQKAIRIEVTDADLIDLTGGIIQGLSGSPIIQNGKLVGAVTHVFVDSPTRGYGICAQTMVEAAGKEES